MLAIFLIDYYGYSTSFIYRNTKCAYSILGNTLFPHTQNLWRRRKQRIRSLSCHRQLYEPLSMYAQLPSHYILAS